MSVRFDTTINVGHLISILTVVLLGIGGWNAMDKRILVLEEFRNAQRDRDLSQDVQTRDKFQEVKEALVDLRRTVEKQADRGSK